MNMKLRTLTLLLLLAAGLGTAAARSEVAAGDTLYVRPQSSNLIIPTAAFAAALATPTADTASTQTTTSNRSLLQKSVVQTLHGNTLHTRKTWDLALLGLSFSRDKDTPLPRCAPKPFYFDVHVPTFYVAFTGMASDALNVRSGNSWELGGYISESRAFTANERFGGSIGFGLSRSYYRLKGRGVLQADEDGHTFLAPIDPEALDYTKPGINYWSWRLPLMLGWQRSASSLHVGVGVEAELRHHVRSRVHSGGDHKHVISGNSLDVQPWACNVLLLFGCGSHSAFARFSLTDFFGPNAEFDAMPFCVGYAF